MRMYDRKRLACGGVVCAVLVAFWSQQASAGTAQDLKASIRTIQAESDKTPPHGTVTAGNGIYQIFVQDIAGSGVGLYTATTGPAHPAGPGLNVLFGNGFPGTSYSTIRSFTSSTDYVQTPSNTQTSTNTVVSLDSFGVVTPLGATGYRTTYVLPGPTSTPDALTITSDVVVNGTTFADSVIRITTSVTNNGTSPVSIGIRYLWDFQIGGDDGPSFQALSPDGPVFVTETQFAPPAFVQYRIVDNGVNPSPPTLFVFGTATGPALAPPPTIPDLLQYVRWPSAVGTAFDYTINPLTDVSTGAGDSAVNYFFGDTLANALTIQPGATASVNAGIFLSNTAAPPGSSVATPVFSQVGSVIMIAALLAIATLALRKRGTRTATHGCIKDTRVTAKVFAHA